MYIPLRNSCVDIAAAKTKYGIIVTPKLFWETQIASDEHSTFACKGQKAEPCMRSCLQIAVPVFDLRFGNVCKERNMAAFRVCCKQHALCHHQLWHCLAVP